MNYYFLVKSQSTSSLTVHCSVEVKKFLTYIKSCMQKCIINCRHSMISLPTFGNLQFFLFQPLFNCSMVDQSSKRAE